MRLFILLLFLVSLNVSSEAKISNETKAKQDYLLIDVRSQEEWDEGHHAKAIHIHYSKISEKIASISTGKDQKIYLYCAIGGRAQIALFKLKKLGYSNLKNLGSLKNARKTIAEKESLRKVE